MPKQTNVSCNCGSLSGSVGPELVGLCFGNNYFIQVHYSNFKYMKIMQFNGDDLTLIKAIPDEVLSYFSCVICSFMASRVSRLLVPCSSLQFARCRLYCSFRQPFSEHKSDTCCSSSSILSLCLSSNSCWVSMILLSSFKYSTALVGFSVGFSMSIRCGSLLYHRMVPCSPDRA